MNSDLKIRHLESEIRTPNIKFENFLRAKIIDGHPIDYHMNVEISLTVVRSCGHEHVIAHLIMSSFGLKRTLLFPF